MAVISYQDILKRSNVETFVSRVNNGGSFQFMKEGGDPMVCTGKVKIKTDQGITNINLTEDTLRVFCNRKKASDNLEVEVFHKGSKKFVRPSVFFKDKEFGGVAGKSTGMGSERQEIGLINLITEAAQSGNNRYFQSLGKQHKLLKAQKNEGLSAVGQEPYIDIFIMTHNGDKFGVSMKGESAPSLAGGGIAGLKVVTPELMTRMYTTIINYLKEQGIKEGSVVDNRIIPDIYIKIPDSFVEKILVGNEKMGGPVDYMYIGKMDVKGQIKLSGEVEVNGKFYSIDEYMKKVGDFYFRIRKRDLSPSNLVKIVFNERNKEGYPMIFKNPDNGKNNFRLVITDSHPSSALVLNI